MFNQTLTSAIQTMSPLWSEQIVKNLGLDVRYVAALNMIFNGISTAFTLEDSTALYIIMLIITAVSSYYINSYTSGLLIRMISKISIFSLLSMKRRNIIFESVYEFYRGSYSNNMVSHEIEDFLYINQHYIKDPRWIFYERSEFQGVVGTRHINTKCAYLQEGHYEVKIDDLHFNLAVEMLLPNSTDATKYAKKRYIYTFHKGSEANLIDVLNIHQKAIVSKIARSSVVSLCYYNVGKLTSGFTTEITTAQYDKSVFDGYYHAKLEHIIDWIDALNKPARFNQPRQVSLMCYGASGSGKSTLTRLIARYTHRSILSIDLLAITKKKDLEELFMRAMVQSQGCCHGIKHVIFELDEFDKTVKVLQILKDKKKHDKHMMLRELQGYIMPMSMPIPTAATSEAAKTASSKPNPFEEIEWDLDDLLKIFSGSYVPDGRIIIATGNKRNQIDLLCPYLLRPGRMTPVEYTYGDRQLLQQIVKDYTGLYINTETIPESYMFSQSTLIEYLSTNKDITEASILLRLDYFSIKIEVSDENISTLSTSEYSEITEN